jgi:hypothetical protein
MAGYTLEDLRTVLPSEEEAGVKQVIAAAWETMKRTNWDDTKFCTINPTIVMTYPMAKNFQAFWNNEGWFCVIKRKERNYYYDIYNLQ